MSEDIQGDEIFSDTERRLRRRIEELERWADCGERHGETEDYCGKCGWKLSTPGGVELSRARDCGGQAENCLIDADGECPCKEASLGEKE